MSLEGGTVIGPFLITSKTVLREYFVFFERRRPKEGEDDGDATSDLFK